MTIKERNQALIEAVSLTDEEWNEAILEGKRKKFFKLKNADYWNQFESIKKESSLQNAK